MIGQSKQRDQPNVTLDPLSRFGANTIYNHPVDWRYAVQNGAVRNQPLLHVSNKRSEHNINNAPLTPGLVVKVLPGQKYARQNLKIRSFPVKLPWQ